MKKLLIMLFVGFLGYAGYSQTKEEIRKDFTGPDFKFDSETIDFGDIAKNSDGSRVFKFKNAGKAPLIISNIKSSCGCTVPEKPEKPVMPGETAEIKIKYDTSRIGPFSKTITITSNAFEESKTLSIKGRVLE